MKKLLALLQKYSALLVTAFKPLGPWGIFFLGVIDSGTIPIPIDAIVGLYIWNNRGIFWLYCIMAAVGSALGSLIPYSIGRAGGEVFLLKRIDRKRFEEFRDRFEKQEFMAMVIPTMLPPPSPCKLFMFCAGVFEMRVPLYLLAVFTGRVLRFFLLALLVLRFGPQAASLMGALLAKHLPLLCVILAVLILGWALWLFKKKKEEARKKLEDQPAA